MTCDAVRLFRILLVSVITIQKVIGSGRFQVDILSLSTDEGLTAAGDCCQENSTSIASIEKSLPPCKTECNSYFRICLSHYQAILPQNLLCTYGELTTDILKSNYNAVRPDYTVPYKSDVGTFYSIPFSFTWPGTFNLIIEAWHPYMNGNIRSDQLLYRSTVQQSVVTTNDWQTNPLSQAATRVNRGLTYRFRVVCDVTYYGPGCTEVCNSRDDQFGHYICNNIGGKECMSGWTGPYCTVAVCSYGCSTKNGYCDNPKECKCRLGWQGALCDECIPYPGCQHGTCDKPWMCNCRYGWGGLLCNEDLNFCAKYRPCLNGGTCSNVGHGGYLCECLPDYTGRNCQFQTNGVSSVQHSTGECISEPCQNNGHCIDVAGGYACVCRAGYSGIQCQTTRNYCTRNPCLHGGTCVQDTPTIYKCICVAGYFGALCQDDVNGCSTHPCANGASCVDHFNGFTCECTPEFSGQYCAEKMSDKDPCSSSPCRNRARCIDTVDDFHCQCQDGFYGKRCDRRVSNKFNITGEIFIERKNNRVTTEETKNVLGEAIARTTEDTSELSLWKIVGLGVGLPILFILLIVLIIILCRRHFREHAAFSSVDNPRRHNQLAGDLTKDANTRDVIVCNNSVPKSSAIATTLVSAHAQPKVMNFEHTNESSVQYHVNFPSQIVILDIESGPSRGSSEFESMILAKSDNRLNNARVALRE